jgi:radical SAM superfamily enzyme YgiQ (UPF0313 family)|tara:strand:+ start:348 stop:1904 length:1557 start_codon:yes stop_codon:yes gene_type:complete
MNKNDYKVLFLFPNERHVSIVPPGIAVLSGLLKSENFSVDLFDTTLYPTKGLDHDEVREKNLSVRKVKDSNGVALKHTDKFKDFFEKVASYKPDLIAVNVTDSTILLAIELLKSVKQFNFLTVLGGAFPSYAPEVAITYKEVDVLCVGEGETAFLTMCNRLREKKDISDIAGLWIKKVEKIIKNPLGKLVDIKHLPPLDFDIFEEKRLHVMMRGKMYKMLPVETHRGCPYKCAFCCSPTAVEIYKKSRPKQIFYRVFSLKKIQDDLSYYVERYNPEYIYFTADTFLSVSKKELDEFCNIYSKFKLPFFIQSRPETLSDYKVKKLKEVGLSRFAVGIEHGNEKYRANMLKRYYSNESLLKSLKILADNKISFSVNAIIGFPDETYDLAMDTVELCRQIEGWDDCKSSIFQPYYGSPLREYCVKKGYIPKDLICKDYTEKSLMTMPMFSKDEIGGLYRTFVLYLRLPKDQWSEIKIAEKFTPEGDKMFKKLRKKVSLEMDKLPDLSGPDTSLARLEEVRA